MNKIIKELARKEGKKIGKETIKKINKILEGETARIIKKSARNADFMGRKIIKEEDGENIDLRQE